MSALTRSVNAAFLFAAASPHAHSGHCAIYAPIPDIELVVLLSHISAIAVLRIDMTTQNPPVAGWPLIIPGAGAGDLVPTVMRGVGVLQQSLQNGYGELFRGTRSEEHTSELPSLMRFSYAVFCLKKKKRHTRSK